MVSIKFLHHVNTNFPEALFLHWCENLRDQLGIIFWGHQAKFFMQCLLMLFMASAIIQIMTFRSSRSIWLRFFKNIFFSSWSERLSRVWNIFHILTFFTKYFVSLKYMYMGHTVSPVKYGNHLKTFSWCCIQLILLIISNWHLAHLLSLALFRHTTALNNGSINWTVESVNVNNACSVKS